ncbi:MULTISPECIES: hypothetical protein [unclassified Aurantimonas]|uniref:hypothetical protein n=1 Tax=unclassified Aurantimonas TaxID=2638230 RepID=UPI002E18C193|nr:MULTISPECIES: hypothetical protein [unclassified Aurantimonas]MEC5289378.1 hypothetical protein [Aurantimonas sp. C2-3-R2]MEC5410458.1 hypothetical protein [Aurantimonas sp. C2-4-R8]
MDRRTLLTGAAAVAVVAAVPVVALASETGGYTGPGLYETTSGAHVWLDVLPEPQAEYLGDRLIWSETAEDRNRPMPNTGTYWGRRDLIEAVIARKL